MNKNAKIYIAGGQSGLVGTALVRKLQSEGFTNLITRTRSELDLLDQAAVENFFATEKPEYVLLAAAKVGGIMANKTQKAEFIYENLQVQNNVIHASWKNNVSKLLFLGSSCIYPKLADQPIKEESFMTGPLEETNDAYAVAKIAGIYMCKSYREQYGCNFISVMPTNLYGQNDNFDLNSSHVLPALIRKFHEGKKNNQPTVTLWGTGKVYREFLHVDDMADACVFLLENYNSSEIINIGTGKDMTIKELAETIQEIVGYTGTIVWDSTKPDGTPKKQLDITKLQKLGWEPSINFKDGIKMTYHWFIDNNKNA